MNPIVVLLIVAVIQYFTIFRMTGGAKNMVTIGINIIAFVMIFKFLSKYLESM